MNAASSAAVAETALCEHCALPVPAGLIEPAAERQFCCHGCRTAYAIIRESGLEAYYRVRAGSDAPRLAASSRESRFEEYDDPRFLAAHARPTTGGLSEIDLLLEGVHCAACLWLIERLPRVAPQVVSARLDLRRARVRLTWDAAHGTLSSAARALNSLGYPPHPARDATEKDLRRREDRGLILRIAVAGALAGNVMLLAFALYGGMFASMEPVYTTAFRWMSAALGLASVFGPGALFLRGGLAALRTRAAHLDLPIAIGLLAGAAAGAMNTVLGRGEIYFDSLAMLVLVLLVGRWVQRMQQRRSADAVEVLYGLTPTSARKVIDDAAQQVPVEAIQPGDVIEVWAGELFPVDGRVERGVSSVDQSLITGESLPRTVERDADVFAGTLNLSAPLRVRASATGAATRLGRLVELVEQAASQPAPIVRRADRIAGAFTLVMLTLGGLTFALWAPFDVFRATENMAALLIVFCPCALGLATPLTLTVAIGRAARRGILIKGAETLEALARPGTIFLDKTGTLTAGRVELLRWQGDAAAKRLAKACESGSAHPLAQAIVRGIDVDAPAATFVRQHATGGIEAIVDGTHVALGAAAFMALLGAEIPTGIQAGAEQEIARGRTAVFVAVERRAVAVAALGDDLRPDAAAAVDGLRRMGWRVGVLSGDDSRVVAGVAERLGIAAELARGDVAPEAKVAAVRAALQRGPTVMIGDGVNDAAALACATVGIAVQGGAEASMAAADIYLNRPGIGGVLELVRAGDRAVRTIRRGFMIAIGYNVFAGALAMSGVINPLIAAILMPLSSLTMVALAVGARTFEGGADRPAAASVKHSRSLRAEPVAS